jgi:hypothetical protein
MAIQPKRVHFDNDGSGIISFSICIIERSTRMQICGDTSAAVRGLESKDPDYGTIAYKRAQRLRRFKYRSLQKKREKTLQTIFKVLKALRPKTCCFKCMQPYNYHSLTPLEQIFFINLPWCGKCQRRISGFWPQPMNFLLEEII